MVPLRIIFNLDQQEYLHPGCCGGGVKRCLAVLLNDNDIIGYGNLHCDNPVIGCWKGDRLVVAGDLADTEGEYYGVGVSTDANLRDFAEKNYANISHEVLDAFTTEGISRFFAEQRCYLGSESHCGIHCPNQPEPLSPPPESADYEAYLSRQMEPCVCHDSTGTQSSFNFSIYKMLFDGWEWALSRRALGDRDAFEILDKVWGHIEAGDFAGCERSLNSDLNPLDFRGLLSADKHQGLLMGMKFKSDRNRLIHDCPYCCGSGISLPPDNRKVRELMHYLPSAER